MSILNEIRNDIVSSEKSLADTLRKTNILATLLRNESLKKWVRNELSGYKYNDKLPKYRLINSPVFGTFGGPFNSMVKNVAIPTYNLPDILKKQIEYIKLYDPVKAIESMALNDDDFQYRWTAESLMLARKTVKMSQNHVLVDAWQPLTRAKIEGVLDCIRNKLLDFVLNLSELALDEPQTDEDIKKLPIREVNKFVKIIVTGDNNVVNSGSENTILSKK